MREIFAGHPPFDDKGHDCFLILEICKGLRPSLLSNMPADCIQMMEKCWDTVPSKRPTIDELRDFVKNKLKEIYENENLEINENNDSSDNNNSSSSDSQQIQKPHPSAYHTSRILGNIIDEFKSLKINTSNNNDSSLNDLDIESLISNADFNKGKS